MKDMKTLRHTLLLYIQKSGILRNSALPFLLYSQKLGIVFMGKKQQKHVFNDLNILVVL